MSNEVIPVTPRDLRQMLELCAISLDVESSNARDAAHDWQGEATAASRDEREALEQRAADARERAENLTRQARNVRAMLKAPDAAPVAQFVRLTEAGVGRVLDGRAGMVFPVLEFVGVDSRCAQAIDFRYPRNDSAYPFQTWTIGPEGFERLNLAAPLTPDPLRRFAFEVYESRGDVSALLSLLDAWAGDATLGAIKREADSQ